MSDDDNHINSLEALRGQVDALSVALILMASKFAALKEATLDIFEMLQISPYEGSSLHDHLLDLERDHCNSAIANMSDDNPALATELKRQIDVIFGTEI